MPALPPDDPLSTALTKNPFAPTARAETDLLRGPLGLRAGWGILLFFLLSSLLSGLLSSALLGASGRIARSQQAAQAARGAAARTRERAPQNTIRPATTFLSEASGTGGVLLAAWGLSRLENRRLGAYGLGPRHSRDLFGGALTGLAALSVLVGLLRGLHLLAFDGRLIRGTTVLRSGATWLLIFVLVGLYEEFYFRGYIQFTLTRGLLGLGRHISPAHAQRAAFWLAAVLWSALFSVNHLRNAGEDPLGIAAVFVAGILFSYALWRTGSLWWGIGFHTTWDWAQSFLFGVPDSGALSAGRLLATHAIANPRLSGG